MPPPCLAELKAGLFFDASDSALGNVFLRVGDRNPPRPFRVLEVRMTSVRSHFVPSVPLQFLDDHAAIHVCINTHDSEVCQQLCVFLHTGVGGNSRCLIFRRTPACAKRKKGFWTAGDVSGLHFSVSKCC